jgi:hypothetical protein
MLLVLGVVLMVQILLVVLSQKRFLRVLELLVVLVRPPSLVLVLGCVLLLLLLPVLLWHLQPGSLQLLLPGPKVSRL